CRHIGGELTKAVAGGERYVAEAALYHTESGNRMGQKGRLSDTRRCQLLFRPFPREPRKRKAQRVIRLLEGPASLRIRVGQVSAHPRELRTLPRKQQPYHRSTAEAHVNPAPNATI